MDIAQAMIEALHAADPVPAGCRLDHARGLVAEGVFRPSPEAPRLSRAEPFAGGERPALVRFSSFGADEAIAEDAAGADPRGMALAIGDPAELVLLGHSVEGFPASDARSFLAFLQELAMQADKRRRTEGQHRREDRAEHEMEAIRPRSPTTSFAKLTYHTLHPYRLTDADGGTRTGRLSIAGVPTLQATGASPDGADRLDADLRARLHAGPVELALRFRRAPAGVDVADISRAWPGGQSLELGTIRLLRVSADQVTRSRLAFDPGTLPDGIAFAGDAMIAERLAAYRLAFERRLDG